MKIGKFYISSELGNGGLLNLINVQRKEYVPWRNQWEIIAISDIFPDVARYDNDPIPTYEIIISADDKGNYTYRAIPV